jgi:hypothetical protein
MFITIFKKLALLIKTELFVIHTSCNIYILDILKSKNYLIGFATKVVYADFD